MRMAAESFVKQRENLGFPLSPPSVGIDPAGEQKPETVAYTELGEGDLLLEIGTEELESEGRMRNVSTITIVLKK